VVDGSGLENRRRGNPTGGSNPSLSATQSSVFYLRRHLSRIAQVRPHSMHSYANPTTEKAQDNAFESIRKSFLCSLLGQFGSAYKKPIASSNPSRENPYRKFEFSIPRHPVPWIAISGDISQKSRK
jgi:hypothetical protein